MDLLTRVVAHLEGFRSTPYRDPVGKLTVGYGHLIKPGEVFDSTLTPDEGLALLQTDLREHRTAVDRLFRGIVLTSSEMDALCSFCFNSGPANLESSTLRRRLLHGDALGAAHEFIRWVWATNPDGTKVRLPGLVKRRDIESVWFLGAHENTIARLAGLPAENDD